MRRRLLWLPLVFLATGCKPTPEKQIQTSNPELTVQQLATFEDCRIYSAEVGRTIYFVRCGARTFTDASYTVCQPCGKSTCCHDVIVDTTVVESFR